MTDLSSERVQGGRVASDKTMSIRNLVCAIILIAWGSPVVAEDTMATPERPTETAPAASAPYAAREDWCLRYTSWYLSLNVSGAAALPSDVRPTHLFETEMDVCKPDPQMYERKTIAELEAFTRAS